LAVGSNRTSRHHPGGKVVGRVLGHVDLGVVGLLTERLRGGRAPSGAAHEFVGLLDKRVVGDDPIHETPVGGGVCIDRVTDQGHFEAPLTADGPSDTDHRRVAEQTTLASRGGEGRRLAGDGKVARRQELASCGRGKRVNPGDHDLGKRLNEGHHLRAHVEQCPHLRFGRAEHVAKVVTGREHRTLGGDDDAERIRLADLAKRRRDLLHRLEGEDIALLGVGQGQRGDVASVFNPNPLVLHGRDGTNQRDAA